MHLIYLVLYTACSIECIKLSWLLNNYILAPGKQSECTQHLLVDSHYKCNCSVRKISWLVQGYTLWKVKQDVNEFTPFADFVWMPIYSYSFAHSQTAIFSAALWIEGCSSAESLERTGPDDAPEPALPPLSRERVGVTRCHVNMGST